MELIILQDLLATRSTCRPTPQSSISPESQSSSRSPLNHPLPSISIFVSPQSQSPSRSPLNLAANPQNISLPQSRSKSPIQNPSSCAFNSLLKIQRDPNNHCKKLSLMPKVWNLQFVLQNSSSAQVCLDSILVFLSRRFLILLSNWLIYFVTNGGMHLVFLPETMGFHSFG